MMRDDQIAELCARLFMSRARCPHCGRSCGYVGLYCSARAAEVRAAQAAEAARPHRWAVTCATRAVTWCGGVQLRVTWWQEYQTWQWEIRRRVDRRWDTLAHAGPAGFQTMEAAQLACEAAFAFFGSEGAGK